MSKPTFEVIIRTLCPLRDDGSPNCSDCEEKDRCEADEGALEANEQEQIAALTSALKELGAEVVEKKLFDAMTREASKYQRLYYALLTMCAEQGFVPTLSKPKE